MKNPLIQMWQDRWQIPEQAIQELAALTVPSQSVSDGRSEGYVSNQIRVAASKMGLTMWRNNSGVLTNDDGVPVRYGLNNESAKLNKKWKSGDLCGVGPHGRFVMCEVKKQGWIAPTNDHERAQQTALNQVNALGGIGFFASHVDHYTTMMQRMMNNGT